jgi:DNA ligase-1
VGDLAETIALLLPPPSRPVSTLTLAQWVEERLLALRATPADQVPGLLEAWWDELDVASRFVWNKLITGGFRVGVSRQTVVQAVALAAGLPVQVVAERLAGDWTPTAQAWRTLVDPDATEVPPSRPYPFFLAQSLVAHPRDVLGDRARWVAEWKWDGIRAQLVCRAGEVHVWSRGEESITARFPEVVAAARTLPEGSVLDGELVAWREGEVAPFSLLQRRIGLVRPGAAALARAPVVFIAWDLLEDGGVDLRVQPWMQRRAALEARLSALPEAAGRVLRLSPTVEGEGKGDGEGGEQDWGALARARASARERRVEGLMLKRVDSAYGIGRSKHAPEGEWWKWKLDPLSVDAVLVYAQRGHGRRASLYTDYTFAVWNEGALVPFAKAYSGLADAEIREVDAFIRAHTVERFGPVRSVAPQLVCEIGFEGIGESPRHKSGIAVRFPRILRLRQDKAPQEADTLARLRELAGVRA